MRINEGIWKRTGKTTDRGLRKKEKKMIRKKVESRVRKTTMRRGRKKWIRVIRWVDCKEIIRRRRKETKITEKLSKFKQ